MNDYDEEIHACDLPLVWPGAIAGSLLAFVIALGEYVASVIVFVPTIGQSR